MRLMILGAGGFGQTVYDIAEQSGRYDEIVFLDDNSPRAVGSCSDFIGFIDDSTEFYPAFGNNETRLYFIEKLEQKGAKIPTLIHKTAYVSPRARVEKGCIILPLAVINTDTLIEKGVIINCGALVDHGCIIGKGTHICLGAIVKAENKIPEKIKIEAGQIIENRTYLLNGEK